MGMVEWGRIQEEQHPRSPAQGGRGLRDMKLFCSNTLPAGTRIRQTFDMIVHTGEVSLTSRGTGYHRRAIGSRPAGVHRPGARGSQRSARGPGRDRRGPLRHRRRRSAVPHVSREPGHHRRDMTVALGGSTSPESPGAELGGRGAEDVIRRSLLEAGPDRQFSS